MKKFRFISFAAIAIAMSASCAKVNPEEPQAPQPKEGMVAVTLNVSAEETTKADLNGLSVEWKVGDKIAVYDCISPDANEFVVTSANGTSATISGEVSEGTTDIYAVSPYSAAKEVDAANKTVNFKLTQPQTIPEGANIAPEALVQVAKATIDSEISFKNVVSLVKFSISAEDVTDVLIVSNGSEKFIGDSKAVFDAEGNVTTDGQSSYRLKVSPASGQFVPGVYYTAVLNSVAATGITFASTGAECKYIKSTDKSVSFQMRKGLNFGDITAGETIPLIIKTKADLDKWAANKSLYLRSDVVKFGNDIDYEGAEWTPVDNYFGSLDGQDYSIYNFKITASAHSGMTYVGFFNTFSGNSVSNLKLGCKDGAYDGSSSITIDGTTPSLYVGTLAGLVKDETNKITITNVINYVPITTNRGTAETTGISAGGLIGRVGTNSTVAVTYCKNYGIVKNISTVSLGGQYYGGIMGAIGSGNGSVIDNCENYAEINLTTKGKLAKASFGGGIIGRINEVHGLMVSNCTNNAIVQVGYNAGNAIPYVGGIVAMDNTAQDGSGYNVTISNCSNTAEIAVTSSSQGGYEGGIIGVTRSRILITECTNTGRIRKNNNHNAQSAYGGIVGLAEGCPGALVKNCTNSGAIQETGTVNNTNAVLHAFGGIVGASNIEIQNCNNTGNITVINPKAGALHCAGGVVGYYGRLVKSTSTDGVVTYFANDMGATISGCSNSGTVKTTLTFPAGGIVGRMASEVSGATLTGCSVNCTVTPGTAANGGMIVGSNEIAATFGTTASPVTVAGTFNGTALDTSNYTGFLYGSSTVTPTVNATLAE